ncbi:MAG: Exonuclease large subunit [Thermotogaceae bacterium]|nr:Exonuclease large subunit [Thermotogaceae bacterium]
MKNRIKQLFRLENSVLIDSERRLESTLKNLKALKPTKPLERGFAIVRKSGKIVNASKLSEGDNVTIEFIDGKAKSTIEKVITRNDTPQNDQV